MITVKTVGQTIEELQKFNPEARMNPSMEIGGNHSTECTLIPEGSTRVELQRKIDSMTYKIDQLIQSSNRPGSTLGGLVEELKKLTA